MARRSLAITFVLSARAVTPPPESPSKVRVAGSNPYAHAVPGGDRRAAEMLSVRVHGARSESVALEQETIVRDRAEPEPKP